MFKVGITGGIGSGKSLVCKIFETLGVPIFSADLEAKSLLKSSAVIDFYKNEFGDIVFTNNQLDKQKISNLIFNDKNIIEMINNFIHPLVLNLFNEWCYAHADSPYVIKEAALLFESGAYKTLDYNILICAPEEIRIQRVMERNQLSKEQILQRMNNQWLDAQKTLLANLILNNDNKEPILSKILETHKHFLNQ